MQLGSVCGWNDSFKRTGNGIQGNATMMDKIQISSSWHTLTNKVCSSKWLARLAVALQYQKIMKMLCEIQSALTTWNIVVLVNITRYVQHQSILHDPMGQKQKPLQWYYQFHINWYQLSQLKLFTNLNQYQFWNGFWSNPLHLPISFRSRTKIARATVSGRYLHETFVASGRGNDCRTADFFWL